MTIEQFEKTAFSINTKVIWNGKVYDVISVDFDENLIGINEFPDPLNGTVASWKRCENCEIEGDSFAKTMYEAYID